MAKKRVGKFPKVFRQMAVERLNHCENIVELAKELGISRRLLYGSGAGRYSKYCGALVLCRRRPRALSAVIRRLTFSKLIAHPIS